MKIATQIVIVVIRKNEGIFLMLFDLVVNQREGIWQRWFLAEKVNF